MSDEYLRATFLSVRGIAMVCCCNPNPATGSDQTPHARPLCRLEHLWVHPANRKHCGFLVPVSEYTPTTHCVRMCLQLTVSRRANYSPSSHSSVHPQPPPTSLTHIPSTCHQHNVTTIIRFLGPSGGTSQPLSFSCRKCI